MTSGSLAKFEVVAFFASDHAEALNGKVYINGGFWNRLTYAQYPAVVPAMSVVAVIQVPFHEYQKDHQVRIGMVDEDGQPTPLKVDGTFRVGASAEMRPGDPTLMPIAIGISGLRIEQAGDYSFTLSIDGEELDRYPIRAVQVATPLRFMLEDKG